MKQIKDYIGKEVAVQCNSQEEWDKIVKLISEVKPNDGPTQKYLYNNATYGTVDCLNLKMGRKIGTSSKSDYKSDGYIVFPASDFLEKTETNLKFSIKYTAEFTENIYDALIKFCKKNIPSDQIWRGYSDESYRAFKSQNYFVYFGYSEGNNYFCGVDNNNQGLSEIQLNKLLEIIDYKTKSSEQDILEQCNKKYPIGTKYKCPNSNTITEVKGKFFKGSTGNKFTDGYGGYVYYEGKFAEIVEEESKFEEGKWYKYSDKDNHYYKPSELGIIGKSVKTSEEIHTGVYKNTDNIWSSKDETELADLSEIQQYLPEGHPDKIKIIPEYVEYIKTGDSSWKLGKIYKVNEDGTVTFESGGNPRDKHYTIDTRIFKPSTKEAYEAQFVKETIKEWYPGTYVVCIENYGSSKIGDVDEITEAPDRNNLYRTKKEGLANQERFKWFATKSEAEAFSKTLNKSENRWIPNPGDWVVILYAGFKCKGNIKVGDVKQIKDFSLDATVNFRVIFTDSSYGNGNTITQQCFRKAELHEIPTQTIINYPMTKEECTIDLSNTKIWIGDNPELSKKVQEKAFELGYKWRIGDSPRYFDRSCLYFSDEHITHGESKEIFKEHKYKEIFPSDLNIKINSNEIPLIIGTKGKYLGELDLTEKYIMAIDTIKETNVFASRVIYSKPKLTELELPTPIKVIKREENYY